MLEFGSSVEVDREYIKDRLYQAEQERLVGEAIGQQADSSLLQSFGSRLLGIVKTQPQLKRLAKKLV